MRKFWKWVFGIKEKKVGIKKKEEGMIEDPKKAMDAWMSNDGKNWKPVKKSWNPWNV